MVPIGGPVKVMPKHDSNRIFTYYGKGGYYGGSHTHVYANPKGDKHERFQVTHQGPDKGGPHGMPAMKVSYHPDALSAQAHAEKLAGKGAERVREETELNELDRPSKGKDTILSRYASRNLQQSRQNAGQSFPGAIDATASTGKKISRGIGLATAANKITGHAKVPAVAREETELDEGNPENKLKKRAVTRAIGGRAIGPAGMQNILRPYNRNPARGAVVANQAALKAGRATLRGNTNEETELDELSQDTLVSYGQKAREAGGRTKGSAMAVKKILAARGKSTGVKVPASEETE